MKLKNLFLTVLAGSALFAACTETQAVEELLQAEISITPSELNFEAQEDTKSVSLKSTRDWNVDGELPAWVRLSKKEGKASTQPQTITVTVTAPADGENDREADIVFIGAPKRATLHITQKGPEGARELGEGTLESPFTAYGAIKKAREIGSTASAEFYYVKGKIETIRLDNGVVGFNAQYGNGTFTLADEGFPADTLLAYRVKYLGNEKWTENDTQIEIGDEMIVYGPLVNFKGNTPETATGAYVYSHNGNVKEIVEETFAEPSGNGTVEDPFNVSAAIKAAKTFGQTPSEAVFYIKGKVSAIGEPFTAQYGNATFELVDEGFTAVFTAYRVYYLGGKKWTESDPQIEVGDEVVVAGKIVNFKDNTPETDKGGCVYSHNGVTAPEVTTADPAGAGTEADPFNVAAAIAKAKEVGTTASEAEFYIKGKVATVSEQFAAQYGNATFTMVDEGYNAEFTAYRILYLGNKKWATGDKTLSAGDEVVVVGKIINYGGNTPETNGSAYLYSLNGEKAPEITSADPAGTGTEADPFNVAAAIAKAKETGTTATAEAYYIKGKIAGIKEQFAAQYGNATFTMVDEGYNAEFTAFRILYLGNKKWAEGDKTLSAGDEVVVVGSIINYGGNTPETNGSSYLYSLNGEKAAEETIATPAGTGTEEDPFNVAAAIAKAQETGETVTETEYYIKGKIAGIKEQFAAQYGNATFTMVDEGYTATFTAFRILYYNSQKWVEGNKTLAVGDEVVIVGKIVNYQGKTPETDKGGCLYSLNGEKAPEVVPPSVSGTGTVDDPFNVAAAIAKAKEVGTTASEDSYYIAGKISSIKYTFSAQYGTATFNISDDGTVVVGAEFTCYSIYYLGNRAWVEGDAQVAVGDEVVVCGKIVFYQENTPETASKQAYIYSLNGQTDITPTAQFGVEKEAISVGAGATSAVVKVTGNVAWTATSTATIETESGEGAGEINVSFPANEDTENAKQYTVTVSTEADVDVKSYTVVITQAAASAGGEGEAQVIEIDIAEYAAANGWQTIPQTGELHETIEKDGLVITASWEGDNQNGIYFGTDWRFYQARKGGITISAPDDKELVDATITFNQKNDGVLVYDGASFTTGSTIELSGQEAFLTVGSSSGKTNAQARITKLVITLK